MPAAATARTAPRSTAAGARRAGARASGPRPRAAVRNRARPAPRAAARLRPARAPGPPRGGLLPVAVGRIPIAVGGIADSGVVLKLTRSRMWIGLLAGLLVGIVALNVMALSFNAASSRTAGLADELKRENSALRAQLAGELSNEQLQRAASALGLLVPEPGSILYLNPRRSDAAAAAERINGGEIALGAVAAAPPAIDSAAAATATPPPGDPAAEPAATTPAADPAAATATPVPEPGATAPAAPSPTATGAAPLTGGVAVVSP